MKSALILSLIAPATLAEFGDIRFASNLRGGGRALGMHTHKGPRPVEGTDMSMAEMSSEAKHKEEKAKKQEHGHKKDKGEKGVKGEKGDKNRKREEYTEIEGVAYAPEDTGNKKEKKGGKEEKGEKGGKVKEEKVKEEKGGKGKEDKGDKEEKAKKDGDKKKEKSAKVDKAVKNSEPLSDWPPTPSPVEVLPTETTPATTAAAATVGATDEPDVLPTTTGANVIATDAPVIDDAPPAVVTDAPAMPAPATTAVAAKTIPATEVADTTAAATTAAATTAAATTAAATTAATTAAVVEEIVLPPSGSPTWSPTSLELCPPPYDPTKTTYVLGELAEVRENIFECMIQQYCNIPEWDDSLLEEDPNAKSLWNSAWVYAGPCAPGTLEEEMDEEIN